MKKNILFWVAGSKKWMGGIYYIKNILFQLALLNNVKEKYNIYVCCDEEIVNEFETVEKLLHIEFIWKSSKTEQLVELCDEYKIDVVLPIEREPYSWVISEICMYWIPDFQEVHFPENFTEKELNYRKERREYIARKHAGLILSSKDALADYQKLYPKYLKDVYVVHFTSYIEQENERLNENHIREVQKKYNIDYEYIFVANQFWRHKNHIVVLEALNEILKCSQMHVHLICTGFMQDDEYAKSLYKYIAEHKMEENVQFLGLIGREEQLCIMKGANLLIQPSKFEGWGCSVEDGKAMGKTILLSDIKVHKEQSSRNCYLFSVDDKKQLAQLILKHWDIAPKYDIDEGRKITYASAYKYANELEAALDSIEGRHINSYVQVLERKRREKILDLFGDLDPQFIGIYGVGKHTDYMLESCNEVIKKTNFTFFDSDQNKWGKPYQGSIICSPEQLLQKGIKRLIISSALYQEEIYESLQKYQEIIEVRKVYDSDKEVLWD